MILHLRRPILVCIFLALSLASALADELLIVQAVSSSGRSFAIAKGARDKIALGQKSLFSTPLYSIMAQAVEVGQENSMWTISSKETIVPFAKGDFVNYSRHANEVWTKLAELKDEYRRRELERKKEVVLNPYSLLVKGGFNRAVSENVNISGLESNSSRQGITGEVALAIALNPRMEISFGFRIDNDSYIEKAPAVQLKSERYLGFSDFSYHFPKFPESLGNIYASLGLGLGPSQSEIDNQIVSGMSYVLPYLKVGYLHPLSDWSKLIVESQIEAITADEKFASGDTQKTTIINAQVRLGLRF